MKRLTTLISALFFLVVGVSHVWALPACPSSGYFDNCYGTYVWEDTGEKHVGEWKDDKAHGQGTRTYADGSKYVGEYKDGEFHGQGIYTYSGGSKYVGEWKDDKQHGQGTYTFGPNSEWAGDKYVGEHKDDFRHGQGTYTWNDGQIWVGAWENGELSGYAITYYASGSINQEGIFKDGKFLYAQKRTANVSTLPACPSSGYFDNCYGTYVWEDTGEKHVGEWKDDKAHGQGTRTYAEGDKYVGEWKDDKQHGQGTYYYLADSYWKGDKYVGEYKDDKVNGQGTYYYLADNANKGDKYLGEYKDGTLHGQGTYTFANGAKYVGEFQDDDYHGQGTFTFADGSKQVGAFENDYLNGYAITYYADGSINQEGIFKDDKFLYAQKRSSSDSQTVTVTCNDNPTLCTVAQLCTKASHYSGGKKAWRQDYSSKKYVTEAKKNELPCGVKVVVNKENPLDNKTYKVASGTGFYVSNSGHIITNHHVIDGCQDMKVISKGRTIETLVLAKDTLHDLALLKAKEASNTYFSINRRQPEALEDITVAGFPFGDSFSSSIKFTRGIVSSLTGVGDNYSEIQIDAALQPGNSGGPIMDDMGNIVGVAVAKLSLKKIMDDYGVVPENTNFGIKASAVRNLMVGNGIVVKEPNDKLITRKQLAKLATDGTVHLTCWMTTAQIDKSIKDETGKVLFKRFME